LCMCNFSAGHWEMPSWNCCFVVLFWAFWAKISLVAQAGLKLSLPVSASQVLGFQICHTPGWDCFSFDD
jgi:hypothetical protein